MIKIWDIYIKCKIKILIIYNTYINIKNIRYVLYENTIIVIHNKCYY